MATTTKNTTKDLEAEKKRKRSAAAKKAAETRKANQAKKAAELAAKAEQEQKAAATAVAGQPIKICDAICETLMLIKPGTESEARPKGEGYSYRECLAIVLDKVTKSQPEDAEPPKTSLDCLRWYATKMRNEGTVLPYRPRNVPQTKTVDPTE